MKSLSVTIQMKATEQHLPVVLFIMLYKVVLTFEFVDELLKCDHSNESYWAVLSRGTVYYAVQGGSNFWVCRWNPFKAWPFKWKLLSGTLLMKVVLTLKTVHKKPTVRPFETKTKLNCTGSHAHTGLSIAFYSF